MENPNESALDRIQQNAKSRDWTFDQRAIALRKQKWTQDVCAKILTKLDEDTCPNVPHLVGEYYYQIYGTQIRRTTLASMLSEEPEWEVIVRVKDLEIACPGYDYIHNFQVFDHRGHRFFIELKHTHKASRTYHEFALPSDGQSPTFQCSSTCGDAVWLDEDTILYSLEHEGDLTPREVRIWKRNEEVLDPILYQAAATRSLEIKSLSTAEERCALFIEAGELGDCVYHFHSANQDKRLDLPLNTEVWGIYKGSFIVTNGEDFHVSGKLIKAGSVVALDFDSLLEGEFKGQALWHSTPDSGINDIAFTENAVIVNMMKNTKCRILAFRGQEWSEPLTLEHYGNGIRVQKSGVPGSGVLTIEEDFLKPATIRYYDEEFKVHTLESGKSRFTESVFKVEQFWAQSEDGTQVPYTVIGPEENFGQKPVHTILEAYGGFEQAKTPRYLYDAGPLWLKMGGLFVMANLRGGGEFGTNWHWGATRENRYKVYQDHEAVTRDLVKRGLTTPKLLGLFGTSNGGLVVAAAITKYSELFGAAVLESPLTDMQNYHRLTRGKYDWREEYGVHDQETNPLYSPLHELQQDVSYPPALVCGGQDDDVVHVSHGRKFALRLQELGQDCLLFEQPECGHGKGETENYTRVRAMIYSFLLGHLKPPRKRKRHICTECGESFNHGIGLRKHQRQMEHEGSEVVEL